MTDHRQQKRQKIIEGDCLQKVTDIKDQATDLVFTSPPYVEQRHGQYKGVPEADYAVRQLTANISADSRS